MEDKLYGDVAAMEYLKCSKYFFKNLIKLGLPNTQIANHKRIYDKKAVDEFMKNLGVDKK